ncbi:MAG: class SAM-dependent methyltransferase [Candidatus Taylorbacteria bacterium]|nr:class SAM-dependent methyltransferase [Candidatus Taylorbacteria bacterium]
MKKPTYTEFSDPRFVALYDNLNALGADSDFFCEKVKELEAQTIIDLGCGTGLLTTKLAEQGYEMIGIEPSDAMLEVARHKPYGEKVKWIIGSSEQMKGLQVDMILMTSHVAQFFLENDEWNTMLKNSHDALKPGGYIVFDARNPLTKPWEKWTRETSSKKLETPNGEVEMWYQLLEVKENRVVYEIHYFFTKTNEELISVNELIYRSQEEITNYLLDAGFIVEKIYGDWDGSLATETSPEMIFIARKI